MKFIIRNDDVAYDTSFEEIKRFCELCDKYGFKIMHAITPIGEVQKIKSSRMKNEEIRSLSDKPFWENVRVMNYLQDRFDFIAVHGLWHTHKPSRTEIGVAQVVLDDMRLIPEYFVPPFNEGEYPEKIYGMTTCKLDAKKGERLEDFLEEGTPTAPIMYLHSWRFDNRWYTFNQLESCLKRLS